MASDCGMLSGQDQEQSGQSIYVRVNDQSWEMRRIEDIGLRDFDQHDAE